MTGPATLDQIDDLIEELELLLVALDLKLEEPDADQD